MEVQMIRSSSIPLLFILFAAILAGCRSASSTPTETEESEMNLQVTGPAFSEGEAIPAKYTCDGSDLSPQLDWTSVPQGTQSLALIADDPDAPVGTWVHWVLFDLPPDLVSLPEGASRIGTQGMNSFRKLTYGGPCPPKGSPHRYYFKLYALDTLLNLEEGASKAEVEKAMQGHILAQGQLMGKYGR
jgi:Raf kinase inhibitor-like YbhB/YbcL family protein